MVGFKKSITFATAKAIGTLTERLGIGLQNRVRRFESARYLQVKSLTQMGQTFYLKVPRGLILVCHSKRAHFIRLAASGRSRSGSRSLQYICTCVFLLTLQSQLQL